MDAEQDVRLNACHRRVIAWWLAGVLVLLAGIWAGPGAWAKEIGTCGEGAVMTDLASITQVHLRALPPGIRSAPYTMATAATFRSFWGKANEYGRACAEAFGR